jgi:hypothetical protein
VTRVRVPRSRRSPRALPGEMLATQRRLNAHSHWLPHCRLPSCCARALRRAMSIPRRAVVLRRGCASLVASLARAFAKLARQRIAPFHPGVLIAAFCRAAPGRGGAFAGERRIVPATEAAGRARNAHPALRAVRLRRHFALQSVEWPPNLRIEREAASQETDLLRKYTRLPCGRR